MSLIYCFMAFRMNLVPPSLRAERSQKVFLFVSDCLTVERESNSPPKRPVNPNTALTLTVQDEDKGKVIPAFNYTQQNEIRPWRFSSTHS